MARIRTLKPDFWTDEAVVELEFWERLLFIGCWNFADDQGFLHYSPKRIKMQVFPADDVEVSAGLARLLEVSLLDAYDLKSDPGVVVLHIRNWNRHQKISNPAKPRFTADDLVKRANLPESSRGFARRADSYPAEGRKEGMEGGEGKGSSSRPDPASPARDQEGFHPEADKLCDLLSDLMVANDCRRPTITKEWRAAARLLLDKDGIPFDSAEYVLRWCQQDSFWTSNIQSMPTFREQFDKLRLRAREEWRKNQAAATEGGQRPSTTDRKVGAALDIAQELDAGAPLQVGGAR